MKCELAGEQIGREIGENIFLLQFDNDGATPGRREIVVEYLKLLRQQRFDVDVETDVAGNRDRVRLHQHRQHAAVQCLRQMLKQPAVGDQVDARQNGFAQILDRDEQFAEHLFRHHLAVDPANELTPHQV